VVVVGNYWWRRKGNEGSDLKERLRERREGILVDMDMVIVLSMV